MSVDIFLVVNSGKLNNPYKSFECILRPLPIQISRSNVIVIILIIIIKLEKEKTALFWILQLQVNADSRHFFFIFNSMGCLLCLFFFVCLFFLLFFLGVLLIFFIHFYPCSCSWQTFCHSIIKFKGKLFFRFFFLFCLTYKRNDLFFFP